MKNKITTSIPPFEVDLEEIFEDEEQLELFKNSDTNSQKMFLDEQCNYLHEHILDMVNEAIIEEIENI